MGCPYQFVGEIDECLIRSVVVNGADLDLVGRTQMDEGVLQKSFIEYPSPFFL